MAESDPQGSGQSNSSKMVEGDPQCSGQQVPFKMVESDPQCSLQQVPSKMAEGDPQCSGQQVPFKMSEGDPPCSGQQVPSKMAEGDPQCSGQQVPFKMAEGDPQCSGQQVPFKMAEGDPQGSRLSNLPDIPEEDFNSTQRVFKKTSLNNKITLYIACRDLVLEPNRAQRVEGVLLLDPEYVESRNVYGQIVVVFRYGREDEEIMGLRFYNETIVNMVRIWPVFLGRRRSLTMTSPLQETLVRRLGPNAIPFYMELFNTAPPSVVLCPTKPYTGQPVGTSYDIRVYMAEEIGDLVCRPTIVRMGIRVTHSALRIDTAPLLTPSPSNESFRVKPRYQRFKKMLTCGVELLSQEPYGEYTTDPVTEYETAQIENESGVQENNENDAVNEHPEEKSEMERSENGGESSRSEAQGNEDISVETESALRIVPRPAPRVTAEKSFLLSNGKLHLDAWLSKSGYHHGEKIIVKFRIVNDSKKTVRRIKAFIYQYVDVCMFDNGKFKNVVAFAKDSSYSVPPGQRFQDYYTMTPRQVKTKNWIALEASANFPDGCLASTVVCHPEDAVRRGISSIFISYYVKLTLYMNRFGGELSIKLPFSLSHGPVYSTSSGSTIQESANRTYLEEGGSSAQDNEEKNIKIDDSEKDDRSQNDNQKDVNDGNIPIGNQVKEVNPEGRQSVLADVSVHIIENQLGEGSEFEQIPLGCAAKPDEEELSPAVRYLETII